ncbi:MAG TPA: 3-methyl-2-oxobutanoate hydroxymethyltransferase, partial [Chthoniobacterales bacterium]
MTAYSYPFARLLDETELDVLLVGDSLAMVEMGQNDTVDTRLEDMIHHVKMVRRAVTRTLLVADLPALSYETPEMAEKTALLLMEAGAEAVKLEGGVEKRAVIAHLTSRDIPVMAHLGMLP